MQLSYIILTTTDPAFNLAAEQYVFDHLPKDRTYLMLWQNENAVIIGKHQNTYAEINAEYVSKHQIKVVRRLSGGGAVYHDLGNLNFTFITDADQKNAIDFHKFCTPIIKALHKMGIPAQINGRNDMLIDGKKFSGNSQYVRGGRVMHHGTLLFDSDLNMISNVLQVDPAKIEAKGIKSVRSRVTNISEYLDAKITMQEFKETILAYILNDTSGSEYILKDEDIDSIEKIRLERYDSWAWNYGSSPPCTLAKKERIEGCGSVEVRLNIENGYIQSAHIYGDFFSSKDPNQLCQLLVGIRPTRDDYKKALQDIETDPYIFGLNKDRFIELLCK